MEIFTKPISKEIELALNGDFKAQWELFKTFEGDEEFLADYQKVKYGCQVFFDIRSIIEEDYEKKVAFGIVRIERKQDVEITLFRNEIDARQKIMKECIRMVYDEEFDAQSEKPMEGYDDN